MAAGGEQMMYVERRVAIGENDRMPNYAKSKGVSHEKDEAVAEEKKIKYDPRTIRHSKNKTRLYPNPRSSSQP